MNIDQTKYTKFIAGGISGVFEVTFTHPLDVIKTKMQNKQIVKFNSIRAMYIGYTPRLIGIIPMRSIFWGSQYASYEYLQNCNMTNRSRAIVSSVVGGICQTTIDTPIEVMKTHLITSHTRFIQHTKIQNIFRGFWPTLIRNIGFMGGLNGFTMLYKTDNYVHKFCLAGLGGAVGSILTQPIDYVKTQVQSANYDGTTPTRIFMNTLKTDPKRLMVGCVPRASLGFINMGIGYSVFQFVIYRYKCN